MYNDYNTDMFVAWLGAWVHKSCIKARDREGERGRGREGGREGGSERGGREREREREDKQHCSITRLILGEGSPKIRNTY